MRLKKSSHMLGDHVEKEDFTARVHVALWPKNDMDTFETILNEHPEVIESKFGRCKDTLLMRYVYSHLNTLQISYIY